MDRIARALLGVAAAVLAIGTACAQRAGNGEVADTEPGVEAVSPDELVPLLISDDDGIDAQSFGPRPMTADAPGDEEYYAEPPSECDDGETMELVAPDDVYAYLGDGGDYLYIDQWITGEQVGAASARFESGVADIEACLVDGEAAEVAGSEVDGVRRYDTALGDGGTNTLVYARHGGVLMLLSVTVLNPDRFDGGDVDQVVDVALGKLEDGGRVEVPG